MCNGPFAIDGAYGWEHGSYINLRRSSSYSGNSKPLPSDVKFSIGNKKVDVSDPVAALTDGTVDAIAMPSDLVEEAKEAGCTVTGFEDTTWGLCFNTQDEVMRNLNIRKAFTQAFSREKSWPIFRRAQQLRKTSSRRTQSSSDTTTANWRAAALSIPYRIQPRRSIWPPVSRSWA